MEIGVQYVQLTRLLGINTSIHEFLAAVRSKQGGVPRRHLLATLNSTMADSGFRLVAQRSLNQPSLYLNRYCVDDLICLMLST